MTTLSIWTTVAERAGRKAKAIAASPNLSQEQVKQVEQLYRTQLTALSQLSSIFTRERALSND